MNYRHAFHAGGFADVIKHIVLVRILTYLQDKQAAFRVIDTHAGAGIYDLAGESLSGIAADRARAATAAGPPDRVRSRTENPQAPDRRAAP
jgi:23S rRNA A2030 N6-methylase RlmJ